MINKMIWLKAMKIKTKKLRSLKKIKTKIKKWLVRTMKSVKVALTKNARTLIKK